MLGLSPPRLARTLLLAACVLPAGLLRGQTASQSAAQSPAAVPAGALTPRPPQSPAAPPPHRELSERQRREADDAYLEGARQVQHKDLAAAERSFARAVELNPGNRDYVLALVVTRENHLDQLVQAAAKAHLMGDEARSEALLAEARAIDPDNPVIAQHFGVDTHAPSALSPQVLRGEAIAASLAGPVELAPRPGVRSFHLSGGAETILRDVYSAFGITITLDSSIAGGRLIQMDVDNVDFAGAARIAQDLTHTFAVAVQPHTALVARDTQDRRDALVPQLEETVYLPGVTGDQMTELANLARNVFDLKQVTASGTSGYILLRGDERTLKLLNATYADMLDGGSDVLFDLNLYEIDKTHINNIGAQLPASATVFSVQQEAQSLVNANQSTLNTLLSTGQLTPYLTGNSSYNTLVEALALIEFAGVTDQNISGLLKFLGSYGGIPLAGLSVSGSATFNLGLTATDARLLDTVTLRVGNGQKASFRAGSRYPVITAQYSSGISSSLASSLSGLNVNGTSVSSLLSKYLGATSVSVPQFQYEDLGITLALTPHVLHGSEVELALDLKIEALAGTSLNSVPVLNNRALTSTITLPAGDTAMLATFVSRNEIGSINGLPGLSELPGFQGTDKDIEKDSDELLITITPHVVRQGAFHIASRRLAAPRLSPDSAAQ